MEYYLNAHTHLSGPEVIEKRSLISASPLARELRIVSIDVAKEQIPQYASLSASTETPFLQTYYSVGLHPWSISEESCQQHLAEVALLSENHNVVAIGECGIDKRCATPLSLQQEVFMQHIVIAAKVGKPMVVHLVKATQELLVACQEAEKALRTGGGGSLPPMLIHGFRGKREQAGQLLNKGFYLSFGGHYNAEALCLAYESGRMLLETDDLNTPIAVLYADVAMLLEMERAQLADKLLRLGKKLFHRL